MKYKTYDCIFTSCEDFPHFAEREAIEYARGMVWSEVETRVQSIAHARHIATVDGVGVYYDYGADYFFFTDEEEEEMEPVMGDPTHKGPIKCHCGGRIYDLVCEKCHESHVYYMVSTDEDQ